MVTNSSPPQQTSISKHGRKSVQRYDYAAPTKAYAVQYLAATEQLNKILHMFNEEGKKETVDSLLVGPMASTWKQSLSNELGRLAQGIRNIPGNDVIDFISFFDVPRHKKVTYANMVCDYRPLKSDPYRVRLTVGGDRLDYFEDTASPAATLLETKLLLNSVVSDIDKNARFMTIDIKDFFLQTFMNDAEYMRIHEKYFMPDIRQKYKIDEKVTSNGYVYCRIKRGMYGLKQAARLAYDALKQHLAQYGYHPDIITPNIWTHETRQTKFCLCVDDFGIKYHGADDANHLIQALQAKYDITVDMKGENFCGLNIQWDYKQKYVDISMKDYVKKALAKFQHSLPSKPQYAPHKWTVPIYGQNKQFGLDPDTSPVLPSKDITEVQKVVGTFLYYARAVDNTILPALNEIATNQAKPTKNTVDKLNMLKDYLSTYPNAVIRFYASDMVLHVESDAAYLVLPKARSRMAGFFYCSNKYDKNQPIKVPLNRPIHVECKTSRRIVTSAAEAETAGVFFNSQLCVPIRHMLTILGHPQPATPIKTDNSTANSFVHDMLKQKRSKSWDMNYHWLSEQQQRGKIHVYWGKGSTMIADYHTKHHAPNYHKSIRPKYILKGFHLEKQQIQQIKELVCKGVLEQTSSR